jgi:hypothetical protein
MGPLFAIFLCVFSLACATPCLVIPKLRRYALRALLIPMAFGLCAIVGMGATILFFAGLVWLGLVRVPVGDTWPVVAGIFLYLIYGSVGVWLAIRVAQVLEHKLARLVDDLFNES